jgi:hypothetical protein
MNILLLSLISCTSACGADLLSDLETITRSEVSTESAFSSVSGSSDALASNLEASASAARQSDGASLWIELIRIADETRAAAHWDGMPRQLVNREPLLAYSGLSIGACTRRYTSANAASIECYDGKFLVIVRIHYRGRSTRPADGYNSADPAGDRIACEGIARRVLARARGLEAVAATTVTVGSASVPALTGSRGDVLVELRSYCLARGLSLTMNARQSTASFQSGSRTVIVPLAANRIKGGSAWYSSQDISVMRNGQWYVPLNALSSACQG